MQYTDTFRLNYNDLNEGQVNAAKGIKNKAQELLDLFSEASQLVDEPRYFSLAKTALEEAILWAVKGTYSQPREDDNETVSS